MCFRLRFRGAIAGMVFFLGSCGVQAQSQELKRNAKADIDTIGNRTVARGPNLYSLKREVALGRQLAARFDSTLKLVDDPLVAEYVNRIGQNVGQESDVHIPLTIKTVDSDEVNAFSLPGGFVYVDSGLILFAESESELAGILAHEIAHVCARHNTRIATWNRITQVVTVPVILMAPGDSSRYTLYGTLPLGLPLVVSKFSRSYEVEADYLGMQYMYKAGYDPKGVLTFLERVSADTAPAGFVSRVFSDHPQVRNRIKAAQTEIATILPLVNECIVTTSQFELVQERLRSTKSR